MKIYFSSNQVPELKDLPMRERQEALHKAKQKLSVPEKLILNIIKLFMLIPPFLFLARQDWGMLAISLMITPIVYFLVMRPLSLLFAVKHIK